LIAPFVERVPMVKGRWDPDASTATCYAWFVWVRDTAPRAPFWIPPGCRTALTRADDRQRFAAWTLSPSGASLFPAPLQVFDLAAELEIGADVVSKQALNNGLQVVPM
jgi:hypothetical protein